MNENVRILFNEVAQQYDQQRKQLIPCFDDFYETAIRWTYSTKESPRILDLGAGTGLLSAGILHKFPHAQLTLVDLSDKMLETARQRFADNRRIEYIVADYSQYEFDGRYDIIVSSLSIHHLRHQDKKALFHKLYTLLEEGGVFINADQAMGLTPFIDLSYKKQWEAWIRSNGLSVEAVEASIERRKLDINATVEDQILWLGETGFLDVDCVYKYNDFAIFHARKPVED
ncbi:class I SAM-dependent methyltransferase [Paenibacillus sp. UNC451MF]|uniref:class I SAM-dependent methyltransferase n=1 Tax=Paenibacillus sp. UNC451MF TaxID=1449063 RepID=UPI00048C2FBC|nr:class I SAM-dependent methyltransferase [Paenibacillus sp. UNC451MF]